MAEPLYAIRYSYTYAVCMSPALNGSSVLQYIEPANAVDIHNGIKFDFYPGLPHLYED